MPPSVSFEAVKAQLEILGHAVPDDVIRSFLADINQVSPGNASELAAGNGESTLDQGAAVHSSDSQPLHTRVHTASQPQAASGHCHEVRDTTCCPQYRQTGCVCALKSAGRAQSSNLCEGALTRRQSIVLVLSVSHASEAQRQHRAGAK